MADELLDPWTVRFTLKGELEIVGDMHPERLQSEIKVKKFGADGMFALARFYFSDVDTDGRTALVRPQFSPMQSRGGLGKVRQYAYEMLGNLGTLCSLWEPPIGGTFVVGFAYDERGRLRPIRQLTVPAVILPPKPPAVTPVTMLERLGWWLVQQRYEADYQKARRSDQGPRRHEVAISGELVHVCMAFEDGLTRILRVATEGNPEATKFLDDQQVRRTEVLDPNAFRPLHLRVVE